MTVRAFLTIECGRRKLGTLDLQLYDETVPKTVRNFIALLQGKAGEGYKGSTIHRLIPKFMAQGGDFTMGDGTGGRSIYGETFADENFLHKHQQAGTLSMANAGPNTNGSQFFICFRPTPHLDGKHVVFGHVNLHTSAHVLEALERVRTGKQDRPVEPVVIVDCGLRMDEDNSTKGVSVSKQPYQEVEEPVVQDADEIDLDDEDEDDDGAMESSSDCRGVDHQAAKEITVEASKPLSRAEQLRQRMRLLKQKANQARQLNRKAIQEEGERSTEQGRTQERKRQKAEQMHSANEASAAQNSVAYQTAKDCGIDARYLTEQAHASVQKAMNRAEKEQMQQFDINDTYNPEGQYRNYQRSLKSLPRQHNNNSNAPQHQRQATSSTAITTTAAKASIFSPIDAPVDNEQERAGAKRLADELHRRIEKRQKRLAKEQAKDMERQETNDVSSISQRNRRFNEKINRTYDKHTAEIRQNLERGTAL